jgi:hypothetical protein
MTMKMMQTATIGALALGVVIGFARPAPAC